jgi:hypothetical protein
MKGLRSPGCGALLLLAAGATFAALALGRTIGGGADRAQALAPVGGGQELVMVVIASSTCVGVQDRAFRDAIARIRSGLRERARAGGATFVSVGVATDRAPESGAALMKRLGPFDELSLGRSWLNSGAVKYIWMDHPGAAMVPQVVVLERTIHWGRVVTVSDERVLLRKAGARGIVDWSLLAFQAMHQG